MSNHRGDYTRMPGVNFSTLKYMAQSPKHYKYRLDNPPTETDAMRLGTAIHLAILEPWKFERSVTVYDGTRRGKAWEAFAEQNANKTILKPDKYQHCLDIAAAVRNNPDAMSHLQTGISELAWKWTDEHTGMQCKGRLDFYTGSDILLDLKTTQDIDERTFTNQVIRMNYHAQMAFYADGLVAAGRKIAGVRILAVEQKPPHDSGVFEIDDDVLAVGRDLYRRWLERLQECRTADVWPGRYQGEQYFILPKWAQDDENDLSDLDLNWEGVEVKDAATAK